MKRIQYSFEVQVDFGCTFAKFLSNNEVEKHDRGEVKCKVLYIPTKPSFFATSSAVAPLFWFNFDTTVSAGWETMAQNTPAIYPAPKVTTSCSPFVHSARGLGTTYLKKAEKSSWIFEACSKWNAHSLDAFDGDELKKITV